MKGTATCYLGFLVQLWNYRGVYEERKGGRGSGDSRNEPSVSRFAFIGVIGVPQSIRRELALRFLIGR